MNLPNSTVKTPVSQLRPECCSACHFCQFRAPARLDSVSTGLGARKKQVGQEVLIPGLKLKFEGTGDHNRVTAETITFDRDDLSLAKVIQAGLNPTAQQQAKNMETYQANKQATDAEIAAAKQEIEATSRGSLPTNRALTKLRNPPRSAFRS